MAIAEPPVTPTALPEPAAAPEAHVEPKGLAIICYSGDLEKTWAAMILASTAGAMAMPTKVFVTFWGLQTFVRDDVRITGESWMQKMMSLMQRPGISHRKLSKMDFFGMGPWMMRKLARRYHVASPRELLDMATLMGVEFIPCQMTMDMFGIRREDLIEGMGEPVGAATYLSFVADGAAPLFI